jgi:hypothetical protein
VGVKNIEKINNAGGYALGGPEKNAQKCGKRAIKMCKK